MAWIKRWMPNKKQKAKASHNYKKIEMSDKELKPESTTTLGQLPTTYMRDYGYIPIILMNASAVIQKNIKTKNIFQAKGHNSPIIIGILNRHRKGKIKNSNVHDVVEVMKTVLIKQNDSILPSSVCNALILASNDVCESKYIQVLKDFRSFSPYHFAILHFVTHLLKKISEYSPYNGMNVRKLAVVFVLDVIRPIEQGHSSDGLFVAEFVQRLPFLVSVVENLIQNVHIFKTVCSHDSGPCCSNESIEHQESADPSSERNRSPCEGCSSGGQELQLQLARSPASLGKESCGNPESNIATGSEEVIKLDESALGVRAESANIMDFQGNNAVFHDFLLESDAQKHKSSSPVTKTTKTSTVTKPYFTTSTKIHSLTTKPKSTKTDKAPSSPDKKPSKFSPPRKPFLKTKKKKSSTPGNKMGTEGEMIKSVEKQTSPHASGQLEENTNQRIVDLCSINGMTIPPKDSKIRSSTMSLPKEMEEFLAEPIFRGQQALGIDENPALQHEPVTEDREDRLSVTSSSSNEVFQTYSALSLGTGIQGTLPSQSTQVRGTLPSQSTQVRDTLPSQSTQVRDTLPSQTPRHRNTSSPQSTRKDTSSPQTIIKRGTSPVQSTKKRGTSPVQSIRVGETSLPQSTRKRGTSPVQSIRVGETSLPQSTRKKVTSFPQCTRKTKSRKGEEQKVSDLCVIVCGNENTTGCERCSAVQEAGNYFAGETSNYFAGETSNYIARETSNYIAGETSNYIAGETSNYIARETSNYIAGETSNYIAGETSNYIEVFLSPATGMAQLVSVDDNTTSSSFRTYIISRECGHIISEPSASELNHSSRNNATMSVDKPEKDQLDGEENETARDIPEISSTTQNVWVTAMNNMEQAVPAKKAERKVKLPTTRDVECLTHTCSPNKLVLKVRYTGRQSPAKSCPIKKRRTMKQSSARLLKQETPIVPKGPLLGTSWGTLLMDVALSCIFLFCVFLILHMQYRLCQYGEVGGDNF